jgi:glucose/arabinose dehydrogenase
VNPRLASVTPHKKWSVPRRLRYAALLLLATAACVDRGPQEEEPTTDWRSDWSVPDGYVLEVDAEGFSKPTAIAFVPDPGPAPGDPLYFVTELGGRVRVVTNDRTVHTFADGFMTRRAAEELPALEGETGLAGICLDRIRGHVFVTFAYRDGAGEFRNEMVRFETGGARFATAPSAQRSYTSLFGPFQSAVSHQIGPCRVRGDTIYVSVADGRQTAESQRTESLLGKILRFHVDGQALRGNPFFDANAPDSPAGFVWASGLRNPFGLTEVDGRIFVADNGSGIDRFLEIERGENYLWDGQDASIAARADGVIFPSVGPAQLDYVGGSHPALSPEFHGLFLVATSSLRRGGVLAIPYSLAAGRMTGPPKTFVRYDGRRPQIVAGLAMGPDGVYIAPILPDASGRSAIYRVRYAPDRAHPFRLADRRDPSLIISEGDCLGCHSLGGEGGSVAPALDRERLIESLRSRLASASYVEHVRRIDAMDQEPFASYRAARQEVLDAAGMQQMRLWVRYKLLEPRFDQPDAQMPDPRLSDAEAQLVAAHLLRAPEQASGGLRATAARFFPRDPGRRHLAIFGVIGFVGGAFAMLILQLMRAHMRSRYERQQ